MTIDNQPAAIEAEIYRAIRKVKPQLADIPLDPTTKFDSLGLASLERAIVVFEIEDCYTIPIVEEAQDTFRTVAEARDVVVKLLAAKAARGG